MVGQSDQLLLNKSVEAPRSDGMDGGDLENQNARMSGRMKPKKDYQGIHRGTSSDFSKSGLMAKTLQPVQPVSKT